MEIDNLNRQKHYFDSTELMFPVLTQSLIGLSLLLQNLKMISTSPEFHGNPLFI